MSPSHDPQYSDVQLRHARDEFAELLGRSAKEGDFQQLFDRCPFILSRALPLRLDPTDISPLGRRGRSEPDFIFYPKRAAPLPRYGIIELKRPDQQILTIPRNHVVQLTRTAEMAVRQATFYAEQLRNGLLVPNDVLLLRPTESLFLGNLEHLFIIMGLSRQMTSRLATDISDLQIRTLLPQNCQILPYDTLFQAFEGTLPPKILVLSPDLSKIQLGEAFPSLRGNSFISTFTFIESKQLVSRTMLAELASFGAPDIIVIEAGILQGEHSAIVKFVAPTIEGVENFVIRLIQSLTWTDKTRTFIGMGTSNKQFYWIRSLNKQRGMVSWAIVNTSQQSEGVVASLQEIDAVTEAASTFGAADVIARLETIDQRKKDESIEQIRSIPFVEEVTTYRLESVGRHYLDSRHAVRWDPDILID